MSHEEPNGRSRPCRDRRTCRRRHTHWARRCDRRGTSSTGSSGWRSRMPCRADATRSRGRHPSKGRRHTRPDIAGCSTPCRRLPSDRSADAFIVGVARLALGQGERRLAAGLREVADELGDAVHGRATGRPERLRLLRLAELCAAVANQVVGAEEAAAHVGGDRGRRRHWSPTRLWIGLKLKVFGEETQAASHRRGGRADDDGSPPNASRSRDDGGLRSGALSRALRHREGVVNVVGRLQRLCDALRSIATALASS